MIKIENVEVMGWEHAIRGMRNPKNSWEKSDSEFIENDHADVYYPCAKIGPNDHDLMSRLAKGGAVHAKYRRMITVYLDITAPLYWWKEFDTYKVGTVANSCSTMHKIHEKEFTLEDFSHEHLDRLSLSLLYDIICKLNVNRNEFLEYKDGDDSVNSKKDYWWQMIQLLPSSYNQRRTIMLNYEVLTNIYESRKNHKLDEWCELCKWIESLPYSEIITGEKIDTENEHNEDRPERIKCQTCNGTGFEQYHERHIYCRTCGGEGFKDWCESHSQASLEIEEE